MYYIDVERTQYGHRTDTEWRRKRDGNRYPKDEEQTLNYIERTRNGTGTNMIYTWKAH